MTKLKPVWRMNRGEGVPSDLGGSSMYFDGEVLDVYPFDRDNSMIWDIIDRDSNEMCAYQTTRTRAAKFERVKCDDCHGYGEVIHEYRGPTRYHQFTETCNKCSGTGRMTRRITC